MSAALEKYAAELRGLSPEELGELSAWLMEHRRELQAGVASSLPSGGAQVAWPDFQARARRLFPEGAPGPTFLDTLLEARMSRF